MGLELDEDGSMGMNGEGPDTLPPPPDDPDDKWKFVEPPSDQAWARAMHRGMVTLDSLVSTVALGQLEESKLAKHRHDQLEAMFFEFTGRIRSAEGRIKGAEDNAKLALGRATTIEHNQQALGDSFDQFEIQRKGDREASKAFYQTLSERVAAVEGRDSVVAQKKAERLDSLSEDTLRRKLEKPSEPPKSESEPPLPGSLGKLAKWKPKNTNDWIRFGLAALISLGAVASALQQLLGK